MKKNIQVTIIAVFYLLGTGFIGNEKSADFKKQAAALLKKQILDEADWAMQQQLITVTASSSPRSAGGKHDFFSEADYFWPDPKNPDGAYINRDGLTNPDNFVEHRKAMIRFSKVIAHLHQPISLQAMKNTLNKPLFI